jgi:hypothetical protein
VLNVKLRVSPCWVDIDNIVEVSVKLVGGVKPKHTRVYDIKTSLNN